MHLKLAMKHAAERLENLIESGELPEGYATTEAYEICCDLEHALRESEKNEHKEKA